MSTLSQITANRQNAQKSTGPRTEAGKNRSKTNACRHNLTGHVTVMTEPDRAAQAAFAEPYIDDLAPQGPAELQLAQSLAYDSWRLNRVRAIEENVFGQGFDGPEGNIDCTHPEIHAAMVSTLVFWNNPQKFATLSLYEQRIHRSFHKNFKLYQELRKQRPAKPIAEPEKPRTMAATAAATSAESTTSKEIGFLYANPESTTPHEPETPQILPQAA